jgi:hypothetical protein
MAGVGGRTPGAGRKPGVPNKATAEIKELARQYGPGSIAGLAELAGLGPKKKGVAKSELARIAAYKEILDRAYGKARQPITGGDDDEPPVTVSFRWADAVADNGSRSDDHPSVLPPSVAAATNR